MLESEDADLARTHKEFEGVRGKFPAVKPDVDRLPRTEEEMKKEAEWLAVRIAQME